MLVEGYNVHCTISSQQAVGRVDASWAMQYAFLVFIALIHHLFIFLLVWQRDQASNYNWSKDKCFFLNLNSNFSAPGVGPKSQALMHGVVALYIVTRGYNSTLFRAPLLKWELSYFKQMYNQGIIDIDIYNSLVQQTTFRVKTISTPFVLSKYIL